MYLNLNYFTDIKLNMMMGLEAKKKTAKKV
jgi:hypothetical protein